MGALFQRLKTVAVAADRAIETFAVSAVALMTLIVTLQVITRKLFHFVFFWSEEITLLLLIWFSFLGIAIGFRDRLHIAMDAFANRLPKPFNKFLDKLIPLCSFGFGAFLVVNGWEFTVLMGNNTMTATGWSSSVMYVIMPITGVMVCIYSILHLLGVDTVQHKSLDEVAGE
ncbi:TRAP transporter small permease [Paenibacillus sp.]|uniref:TRAP transporter small permease n=1 Tax=Paenibacillus sp. TaxID=58172 RepID=UPI002D300152|nr:TRAP transporter small permease [Paenibacillus sp.]HZG85941.1 TRAP transporter small permease [Paenibacillus sp.]